MTARAEIIHTSASDRPYARADDAGGFIAVRTLSKTFAGVVAVNGVSFDVQPGSTLALLGPSGCGKTTILRCIAGLETPDAGRISIGGKPVFDHVSGVDLMPEQRDLGIVFQSYAIWPHMSVAENVGFPLRVRRIGRGEIQQRVERILALVGLADGMDRPATDLSGGQQQRVALARALIHEPRLVLFDEPMSNLDAQLREHMRLELKMLQRRLGFTAIFVTHDQAEAFAIADDVVVMNHGSVEMSGPPRTVACAPQSAFVARFLGFNVIPGLVDKPSVSQANAAFEPFYVDVRLDGGPVLRGGVIAEQVPKPGERVFVCIRREHISARKVEEPYAERLHDHTQVFPGEVKAATFLGFHQEYILEIDGLEVRAVQLDMGLETGDEVEVHIRPQSCIVLPDRAACLAFGGNLNPAS